MEYVIETFGLTKIFSDWWGRNKVYAVDGLDLKVKNNEVFGLLGPNGSGKTTILKILLGLLHPTKGKAVVLGGNSKDPKINARIGFMPEESYLYRYLNARETLNFYGQLFGLPAKVIKTRTEALLEMVGLTAMGNRAVGTFSKGMARRIGLAQALINDPEVLILDEPTTGLDPLGTRQIKDLILQLAKRGKTVLLCSHLLADVEDVCDRIAILYGGKIQSQGKVKELLQQTDKLQITTSCISDTTVGKIKQLLEDEQADFSITSPMEKLEAFFIKTVLAAQQSEISTSGVISGTRIGGFLSSESAQVSQTERILDKLVSADMSEEAVEKAVETEPVSVSQISETEPDEDLLAELTVSSQPETTPAPTQPANIQKQQQINEDILEQLTKARNSDNNTPDQTPETKGDSGNA